MSMPYFDNAFKSYFLAIISGWTDKRTNIKKLFPDSSIVSFSSSNPLFSNSFLRLETLLIGAS